MLNKSVSEFFIRNNEQIKYSLGYDIKNDKLSSSSLIITQYYLYAIGTFLFRDSRIAFSETNGFKVIELNSISGVTEIKKKNPLLFSLFIILLIVSLGLFLSDRIFPEISGDSNLNIEFILVIVALFFLIIFFLLTKKMLHVEFCGGELLFNLDYKSDEVIKISKIIFQNKNIS